MTILLASLAAFILGMSKAGLKGLGIIVVTLMALAHGAKASTGIIVPLLIVGDVFAVNYYNRHTKWAYLKRLLPFIVIGIGMGAIIGKYLDESQFQKWMAIIILLSVTMMFVWERYDKSQIPNQLWFAGVMGFGAGFTTMIGNLAGAFANVYFLATKLPKNEFIGTAAWLFFIVNLIKLPVHIFHWHTVDYTSLLIDLYLIPAVILGFLVGLKLVSRFKEKQFRYFILTVTAIGALIMLIKT